MIMFIKKEKRAYIFYLKGEWGYQYILFFHIFTETQEQILYVDLKNEK